MNNSKNDSCNDQLGTSLPGSLHYNFAFPWDRPGMHVVSGSGHKVTNLDGDEYWDFFSKFGAAILGHGNQAYAEHIAQALVHNVTAVDHFGPAEVSIIERLLRAVPGAEQVRFSLSGTEAVLNALRIARAYTKKNKVIRFVGHYHGNTDALLGGGSNSQEHSYDIFEAPGDPRGTEGRAAHALQDSLLLPWNDTDALQRAIEQHKGEIAAIIMEPICINGGGISASPEYFTFLRALATEHGILVIFDEVITGFRLGFGSAQSLVGIQPDMWIFGKAIAGGSLPVSCVMSSKQIMQVLTDKKATHGGTFNGYPVGLYAVEATLNILEQDPALYEKATARSNAIREGIVQAADKHGVAIAIQGHPMAMCLHASDEILSDGTQWTAEMKAKEAIIREAFKQERIVLAPPCRMYPSIALDDANVTACTDRMDAIFANIRKEYDAQGYTR